MKRILIISQYFYPESFRVNDLASNLVKRGYRVTVLTGYPNYPQGKFYSGYRFWRQPHAAKMHEGVSIIRLPILPRGKSKLGLILNYFSFWILGHLFVLFTRRRFDLVFTYGISPIFQGAIANHYARKFKVKSFLYLMDFWPYSIAAVDGIRNRFVLKQIGAISQRIYTKTDQILISSPGYLEDLVKMDIPSEKVFYWPQYHEAFYRPLPKDFKLTPEINDDGKFKICFTGNLGYGQGILEFLAYLQAYQDELRKMGMILYFIGDGRAKTEILSFINVHGLNDLVIMISRQAPDKIAQYLANCDVALLLIKNDTYMTKVLPAKVSSYVGCQKPIFCVSDGNLASYIHQNKLGKATDGFDHVTIHQSLKWMYESFKAGTFNQLFPMDDHFQSELLLSELESLWQSIDEI